MRRLVLLSLALGALGCDVVRVEPEPDIGQKVSPRGVVVAAAPPGFGEARLQSVIDDALSGGQIIGEAIDVAARATGGLEAAACNSGTAGATADCAPVAAEFDAAVMDASGRFGAVIAVTDVGQPATLARLVAETSFLALVGDGAKKLAGAPVVRPAPLVSPATSGSVAPTPPPPVPRKRHVALTRAGGLGGFALVVRLADGQFAAAASSAGAIRMPRGRLTAVGIEGAAVFSGGHGAVAVNGDTAHLLRTLLAKAVYQRMAGGEGVRDAIAWAIANAPPRAAIAIVAIDDKNHHAASNRSQDSVAVALAGDGTDRVED